MTSASCVIFLDVDGVLNRSSTWAGTRFPTESVSYEQRVERHLTKIERLLVERLRRLVQSTSARIVLTSAWRLKPSTHDALRLMLQMHGFDICGQTPPDFTAFSIVYDRAPRMADVVTRGVEILAWFLVEQASQFQNPEIMGANVRSALTWGELRKDLAEFVEQQRFVILDDSPIVPSKPIGDLEPALAALVPHILMTSPELGLTDADVDRAIRILGGKA